MKKIVTIVITVLLLTIIGGVILMEGFHLMTIEDHYGDLQNIYFESVDGDILVNKNTGKVGVIKKTRKYIHIIDSGNKEIDLYNWVANQEKQLTDLELYRPKKNFIFRSHPLDYNQIQKKTELGEMERIITEY